MQLRAIRVLTMLAAIAVGLFAQEYSGPPPEKADVPYLLHAENLIETEQATARQEERKKDTAYVISGAASPVRTPLAEPIFIMKADTVEPQQLELYSMNVDKGNRETVFPEKRGKDTPRARYLTYKRIEEGVYWIEVNEYLDNGQYCLTPKGTNDVFCFEIY